MHDGNPHSCCINICGVPQLARVTRVSGAPELKSAEVYTAIQRCDEHLGKSLDTLESCPADDVCPAHVSNKFPAPTHCHRRVEQILLRCICSSLTELVCIACSNGCCKCPCLNSSVHHSQCHISGCREATWTDKTIQDFLLRNHLWQ